jgi:hypothetical protein
MQEEALKLKNQLEDDVISGFINSPATMSNPTCQTLQVVLAVKHRETYWKI